MLYPNFFNSNFIKTAERIETLADIKETSIVVSLGVGTEVNAIVDLYQGFEHDL